MMNRRLISNSIGCLSIACSLGLWVLVCIGRVIGHFPLLPDLPFNGWVLIWAAGLLLALAAAALGSRRWAFAAILPVISFIAAFVIVLLPETWHR